MPRAITAPVRLVPLGSEPLRVSGLHSYFGAIRLDAAADGLVVINELPLERYLLGLNEVPSDWPMEALRAQAVAARTYALWTLGRPPAGAAEIFGFDICASDQCQVFSGADVSSQVDGARWTEAVGSTAGRAILYEGEPILARYHSTSGGQTLSNSQAFAGDPDLPYLRPVKSTTEEASPLYRWRVLFTLEDLQAVLQEAGSWSTLERSLVDVRTVPSRSGSHYPDVVFEGARALRWSAEDLRTVLRDVAPRLWPGRYPSAAPTGSGRLPETLPSNRITISTDEGIVEIVGRGWGHGVGMSQWGAHGMALGGSDHRAILEHYYSGVEIGRVADAGTIEVGVDWARSSVDVLGSFRVIDGAGETVLPRALGTWSFHPASGGVSLTPPRGYGRPLQVRLVRAPQRARAGRTAPLTIHLSAPARVVAAAGAGGRSGAVTRDAGRRRVSWRAPSEPGRYRVTVRASDGAGVVSSAPVEVVVVGAPPGSDEDAAPGAGGGLLPAVALWIAAGGFLLVVAVGAASFVGTIGRWTRPPPSRNR
ncbi:hypothetical protein BH24ACT26_BH24ACT26_04370 [soil metagenome]